MKESAGEVPSTTDPVTATPRASTPRDLDRMLARGVAWAGGLKWGAQIISWLSTLLVVRLLTPADYGIMGMATLYLGLIQLLSEFGVGTAVVTLRQLDRRQVWQLNTLSVALGVGGSLLSCLVALPIASFFHTPRLAAVVAAVGSGFLISSFGVVPSSLLARDMEFKQLSFIGMGQALATSVAVLTLAWAGLGYWALALGNLLGLAVYAASVMIRRPQRFARPRMRSIRPAVAFSSHIIVSRVAWYTYANADFLVIGRVLGQGALGLYTVAWSIGTMAVDKITAVIGQVTPSVFAAGRTDPAIVRRHLLGITEAIALITFPAAAGLALVAGDFAPVVLGEKWTMVAQPLRFLACYGIIRSVTPLLAQVLNAIGESFFSMLTGLATAIVLPTAFFLAARWGITGVAIAWLIGYPLCTIPLYVRVFRRIDLTFMAYLGALWPAVSGCLVMAAVVLTIQYVFPPSRSAALGLSCQVAGGALAYAGLLAAAHGRHLLGRLRGLRAQFVDARG